MQNNFSLDIPETLISPLGWDTEYFHIRCGKAVLQAPFSEIQMERLLSESRDYDFVSIQNVDNDIDINRLLARYTDAYLVDVNIQFEKAPGERPAPAGEGIIVPASALEPAVMTQMTVEEKDFAFSKFVCDPKLKQRAGYKVYECWLKNAAQFPDKQFLYRMQEGKLAGFILFRVRDRALTAEIVKVNAQFRGQGIARALLSELDACAAAQDCRLLRVGTQLNNIPAINLYHRLGYRDVSRTSVYHLWNV